MNRTEFVNQVFKTLEEKHIYLYHDISKEEFENHKQEFLKNIDELDENHFEAGMLKLFALFRDAHTSYYAVDFAFVEGQVILVGKDFFIRDGDHFKKIKKVNGHDIEKVVKKLKELVNYEVETWAYYQIASKLIYSPKAMQMIDCGVSDREIVFTCGNNETIVAKLPDPKAEKQEPKRKPWYESSKVCDDKVLYVRYRRCRNMEDYSFAQFVEDIAKEWQTLPKACLVDVRFNTGGSSDVIYPLTQWLKEHNIKTYMLMNEGTFSGGTFALAELKRETGATLIGTGAGQPTRYYAECPQEEIDGKRFSYCKKYFELTSCHDDNALVEPYYATNAFDYVGVIKPDIEIEPKIEDLNKGIDTQLEEALKIIEKEVAQQNEKET